MSTINDYPTLETDDTRANLLKTFIGISPPNDFKYASITPTKDLVNIADGITYMCFTEYNVECLPIADWITLVLPVIYRSYELIAPYSYGLILNNRNLIYSISEHLMEISQCFKVSFGDIIYGQRHSVSDITLLQLVMCPHEIYRGNDTNVVPLGLVGRIRLTYDCRLATKLWGEWVQCSFMLNDVMHYVVHKSAGDYESDILRLVIEYMKRMGHSTSGPIQQFKLISKHING